MSPIGSSLPLAPGKGRGNANHGYGKGRSSMPIDSKLSNLSDRFADQDVNDFGFQRSGFEGLSSVDMSAIVKKAVFDALATIIPSLVSEAVKQAGDRVYDLRTQSIDYAQQQGPKEIRVSRINEENRVSKINEEIRVSNPRNEETDARVSNPWNEVTTTKARGSDVNVDETYRNSSLMVSDAAMAGVTEPRSVVAARVRALNDVTEARVFDIPSLAAILGNRNFDILASSWSIFRQRRLKVRDDDVDQPTNVCTTENQQHHVAHDAPVAVQAVINNTESSSRADVNQSNANQVNIDPNVVMVTRRELWSNIADKEDKLNEHTSALASATTSHNEAKTDHSQHEEELDMAESENNDVKHCKWIW
ncbi:hypothetical protein NE237_015979 [Protea cynaroides]|uniref:Uncharacterized protein n=1 Tax=Protea cynaroides TaxID=273540 RepID=A0A9Q0KET6_9MAGN|nr:hypothetical protein NE237_015979 [Protea cynaroides]